MRQHIAITGRRVDMKSPARSLALTALVAVAMWAIGSTATASTAAACVGGTSFDWAVEHEHGGIVRANVEQVSNLADFTNRLALGDAHAIRGNPRYHNPIHAVAGAICDQSADVGETILVLFDIRGGQYPNPLPLFYVIRGADALDPGVVAAGLAAAPATDASATRVSAPLASQPVSTMVLAGVWAVAFLVAVRRFSRR